MMKHRKMKKTTVKGMTLIECIIALFVFGLTALMLVTVCSTVCNLLLDSNHLGNKTVVEAPIASVQNKDALENMDGTPKTITGADGIDYTADAKEAVTFTINGSVAVPMDKYNTAVLANTSNRDTNTNMEADLYFYVTPPTGP